MEPIRFNPDADLVLLGKSDTEAEVLGLYDLLLTTLEERQA